MIEQKFEKYIALQVGVCYNVVKVNKKSELDSKNKQNRQKEKVMNNTNENKTSDIYLAHVDFETGRTQSFQEHTDNVTSYAKSICPMEEIQKLVEAAALFHDAGKLSDDVQKDFQDILKKGDQAHRNDLDHSTAGGRMLWKMMRQKTAAELLKYSCVLTSWNQRLY